MKRLLAIALLLTSFRARAEMPMEVISTADDPVGRQLVYAVKEKIRQSSSMEITFDSTETRMQTYMVTMDQYRDNPGVSTVYSVVVTWNNPEQPFPFFLTQYTGYCGASKVESCAADVVAGVSEQSDSVIRLLVKAAQQR